MEAKAAAQFVDRCIRFFTDAVAPSPVSSALHPGLVTERVFMTDLISSYLHNCSGVEGASGILHTSPEPRSG